MKFYTYCKNQKCKEEINFKASVKTRFKLAEKRGVKIVLKCSCCGEKSKHHVNTIKAEVNTTFIKIANIIFFIGTPIFAFFIWNFIAEKSQMSYNIYGVEGLGVLIGIPYFIYARIKDWQETNVLYFNAYEYY